MSLVETIAQISVNAEKKRQEEARRQELEDKRYKRDLERREEFYAQVVAPFIAAVNKIAGITLYDNPGNWQSYDGMGTGNLLYSIKFGEVTDPLRASTASLMFTGRFGKPADVTMTYSLGSHVFGSAKKEGSVVFNLTIDETVEELMEYLNQAILSAGPQ